MEAMSGSPVRQLVISSRIQDRQFVRVSVEDSGPGVPKAIAENLFRAFVSTKAQGMGLGLSICRTIIEANGGRIWLEPRSGGGSIFHFTLRSEEHTSELQSLMRISYAVFCLKKKKKTIMKIY